jgi:threonyl-tRNA synthetase
MKLLMFYANSFWYTTYKKVLPEAEDVQKEAQADNAIVVFIHAEEPDEKNEIDVLRKAIKNVKWLAGKFGTNKVVLHSFSHLSSSKSSPDFAQKILESMRERLKSVDYEVELTPFGYLEEFKIHVAGESLAKVFKEI